MQFGRLNRRLHRFQTRDRIADVVRFRRVVEDAAEKRNGLERAAASQGDHRFPAGQGFHRGNAEILLAGKQEEAAASVKFAEFLVGHAAQELDIGRCDGPQCAVFRSGTGDSEALPGAREMADQRVDALIGHKLRDGYVEDPEAALSHARAARARASRIAAVREAVGIAAYYCGDWAQALAELRAARRMGSKSSLLALIADCERGLGRPERAIELARGPEAAELTGDDADELRIVAAGARVDLGQTEQALTVLSTPQLEAGRSGSTAARLYYAYADTLLALERQDEALEWFLRSAAADTEGVTDAEDRVSELG